MTACNSNKLYITSRGSKQHLERSFVELQVPIPPSSADTPALSVATTTY